MPLKSIFCCPRKNNKLPNLNLMSKANNFTYCLYTAVIMGNRFILIVRIIFQYDKLHNEVH